MQRTSFLLLITITFFSTKLVCQNLYLTINGSSQYENKVIDSLSYLKTHKNYTSINFELDSIQRQLYNKGYIENELKNIKKKDDSTFVAQFHLKNKFKTISIYYDKSIIDSSILNLVSKHVFDDYFKLDFKNIENALAFINSKISEKGNPFSKLQLSNISKQDTLNLKAHLIIESVDQKRTIDKIIIKGYEKFPMSYLKHYLKIKTSQSFNLSTIKKKTTQLNNLRFATQTKPPEVLFTTDSTSLYIYLEKSKSNAFDGFLGFGTNETSNKIEFDGYLNLNLTNNLNFGESFKILYKSDENDQKTFKTNLTLPYLFKSPVGIDLELQIFQKDSSFSTTNQFTKLHYQINSKHKIYAGLINSQSNNLLTANTTLNITDYKTTYTSLAYEYLKLNAFNSIFPINSKFYFETNFGERKLSNTTEKQSQFIVDAFKIFNLNAKNSIYIKSNYAILISNTYLENELLRFGGINSIRGFEENSLFSSQFGVINTEYRFLLGSNTYIHSIIDGAYFENKILNTKEKLFSYGFGFGILTKSGVFRFNYANGKIENQKFKLSNSKIHISLTTNF